MIICYPITMNTTHLFLIEVYFTLVGTIPSCKPRTFSIEVLQSVNQLSKIYTKIQSTQHYVPFTLASWSYNYCLHNFCNFKSYSNIFDSTRIKVHLKNMSLCHLGLRNKGWRKLGRLPRIWFPGLMLLFTFFRFW